MSLNIFHNLKAIDLIHHDICNDDIEEVVIETFEPLFTIGRCHNFISFTLKQHMQVFTQARLVINHQKLAIHTRVSFA